MNWKTALSVLISLGVSFSAGLAADEDAGAAWKQISELSPAPAVPEAWKQQRPDRETVEKWRGPEGDRLLKLGNDAADFAQKFPQDANASAANQKASEALFNAVRLGRMEANTRLGELDTIRLKDAKLDPKERFNIRIRQVQMAAQSKLKDSPKAAQAEFLTGARALVKEFPGRDEPYRMMVSAADGEDAEANKAVLQEVVASKDASEEVKERAQTMLAKMDLVGKPLDLKFTAVDGREVDVQKMKGQVVLVDFWATWCGPCVRGLPEVIEVYTKFKGPKFEIIGIDLDQDKAKLESFVKEKAMPWPQYFDGKAWENVIAQKYGINSIPSMWLVDKKGILRDMEARENLAEKVKKLVDEE